MKMEYSKCCCGCIDVRKGTQIIADIQIAIICICFVIITIYFFRHPNPLIKNNELYMYLKTLVYIFLFLALYINSNLKKATQIRKVKHINHWLLLQLVMIAIELCLNFVVHNTITRIVLHSNLISACTIILIIVFNSYLMYVVKCFYDEEFNHMTAATRIVRPKDFNSYEYLRSSEENVYGDDY